MLVSKRSPRTGEVNTRDINCTQEQYDSWKSGAGLIQRVMPNVSAEDREFLISGYTPEDWEAIFGKD